MVRYFAKFEDCFAGQEVIKRDGTPCLIEVYVPSKNHVWVLNLTKETVEEEPVWGFRAVAGVESVPLAAYVWSSIYIVLFHLSLCTFQL